MSARLASVAARMLVARPAAAAAVSSRASTAALMPARCFSSSSSNGSSTTPPSQTYAGQPGNTTDPHPYLHTTEGDSAHGVLEGQADRQSSPVGLTGGSPDEFIRRTCRIYKPSRSATQQGPEYRWKIEFDTPNKWVNPLMGWTSARDTAQQLREMLYFTSEADAVAFAEREGFAYTVLPYHSKHLKAKAFADNFKWKGPPKDEQKK